MSVRRISTMCGLEELKLRRPTLNAVQRYSVEAVAIAARGNSLTKLINVGPRRAAEILRAFDEAGFIFHETWESSGIRRLLQAAFGEQDYRYDTEAYESQREFSSEQISYIDEILSELLPREEMIVRFRFGFDPSGPHTIKQCAETFYVTEYFVKSVQTKILHKLHRAYHFQRICRTFPEMIHPCLMTEPGPQADKASA